MRRFSSRRYSTQRSLGAITACDCDLGLAAALPRNRLGLCPAHVAQRAGVPTGNRSLDGGTVLGRNHVGPAHGGLFVIARIGRPSRVDRDAGHRERDIVGAVVMAAGMMPWRSR